MPIYEKADDDICGQMQDMLDRHHPGLRDAMVKVDVILAKSKTDEHGQPLGPAIKHHGVVVAGYARILGLKDRVMGRGDAEIVVDGDRWPEWGLAKQNALLDHELNHLEVRVDSGGAVVRDDASRPLLKIKPHDYEFGWFVVIAERHGDDSFEKQQAEKIFTQHGQLLFPFAAGVTKFDRAEAFLDASDTAKAAVELAAKGRGDKTWPRAAGGGVDTVTLTAKTPGLPDRTVTLTGKHRNGLDRNLKSIAKELAGKQPSA